MSLRLAVFFLALALGTALVGTYVGRRTAGALGLSPRGRRFFVGVVVAAVSAPPALRLAGFVVRDLLGGGVALVGSAVGLTTLVAAAILAPLDALGWVARQASALVARRRGAAEPAPPPGSFGLPQAAPATAALDPSVAGGSVGASDPLGRRDFLSRAAVGSAVFVGAGASAYGIAFGRHDYVVETVPIGLSAFPAALDGTIVVQLSDLHVGLFVGERELDAAVDRVRAARGDLVVLTGDLLDHDPAFAPLLGRFVRRLVELRPRHGVFAIPGNHDYYAGVAEVLATVERAGATVLRNDARAIGDGGGSFALLGVDDVWAGRSGEGPGPDLDRALHLAPEGTSRVLLCHNPELYPRVADRVDLQLSGHTHGGQVNLVVRPVDLVLRHGYIAGHYRRGRSQIYVNRGFGTAGPPARIGSPPEVTRLVLHRA